MKTVAELTRSEFENATGSDECENFTYSFERNDEVEYQEADMDSCRIGLSLDENDKYITVSCQIYVADMVKGAQKVYAQRDGWGELAEYTVMPTDRELYLNILKLIQN